ncbi:alpha/beta hydrolase [Sinirhodobacter populi]|uniref:Alpha/beta hydrolase n=1 Tax=Paenirhodobacter populi TaxID=2306993 RepID=A0A443KB38_9RHOB|nr:alpha/beta hydrolase [Sinirhodobacter populi]RWR30027.1 alpha/beta hydrolase [Sinirhodobacter populi]
MARTLLVAGLDGSPAPHWQHWWAMTDPTALPVELSTPHRPVRALWETELAGMILQHPDSVLVGHSLGAILIARVLTNWPQLRVRAALLVAPAETRGNDRIGHFGPVPENPLPVPATVVASRNDPWMDYRRACDLAALWGADCVDLGNAGHINVAAGYGPWPLGKVLRDRLLRRAVPAWPAVSRSEGKGIRT